MIQRYSIYEDGLAGYVQDEADNGKWVRWEDVEHCVDMWDTITGMMQNCCSCETHSAMEYEIEKYWRKKEDNS